MTVAELLARLGQGSATTPRRRRHGPEEEEVASEDRTGAPAPEAPARPEPEEPSEKTPTEVDDSQQPEPSDADRVDRPAEPDEPDEPEQPTEPDEPDAFDAPEPEKPATADGSQEPAATERPDKAAKRKGKGRPKSGGIPIDPSEEGERERRTIYQRHPAARALLVVGIVVAVVVAYYVAVLFIARGNIDRQDVLRVNGPEIVDPRMQDGAQNYLIVISDSASKDAAGAQITALAHLSADEKRLVIVSFSRTTVVDVPPCGTSDKPVPAFTGTIESAYAAGGARCSVAVVQATTGIRINHYIGVDLGKFPKVIDALGGLDICLRAPLEDPALKLSLPAGTTTLDGSEATDYVRAVNQGSGDDPGRAARQINFLSTLFSKALSAQTLLNPVRTTTFAFASADVLTLDSNTTLGQLRTLGTFLSDLGATGNGKSAVIVVPPMSTETVVLPGTTEPGLRIGDNGGPALFDAIITGQPVETTPSGNPGGTPSYGRAKTDANAGPGAIGEGTGQGSTRSGGNGGEQESGTPPVAEVC